MLKGTVSEQVAYQKWVGVENLKPLIFNPDKEQLSELLETEIENEQLYTGKQDKDGNPMSTVLVWCQGEISKQKFPVRFTLIDKDRISTKNPANHQYLNSTGSSTYSDSKENLPEWFTHFQDKDGNNIGDKMVKIAKVGEEELYSFIKAWLHFNYYSPDTELSLNFNKLMEGDVRDLENGMKLAAAKTVVGVATVRNVDKDGEIKQYQGISTKAFLAGKYFKFIQNGDFSKNGKKVWEKFTKEFIGEYGEKAFFSLDIIHPYEEGEDITASNEAKVEDNSY
jgi:hypothetical protein